MTDDGRDGGDADVGGVEYGIILAGGGGGNNCAITCSVNSSVLALMVSDCFMGGVEERWLEEKVVSP